MKGKGVQRMSGVDGEGRQRETEVGHGLRKGRKCRGGQGFTGKHSCERMDR